MRALLVACALVLVAAPALADDGLVKGHEQQLQRNRHGLGLTAGVYGTNGFAYRNYQGNLAIQVNLLPLYANNGDYLSIQLGAQVSSYMLAWTRGSGVSLVPGTTALRLTGGYGFYASRDNALAVPAESCKTVQCQKLQGAATPVAVEHAIGAGFGFEFGAVMRPGFSVAVDLLMTVRFDGDGFLAAYPLPTGALMYSW
jgi:hypothetical protein